MRRHDWVERMFAVIDAHSGKEFEWGKNDCCLFAARVVDAMCDTEHEVALSQHYHDEKTALAYIKESVGIAEAVSTYIGEPKDGRPQRGDVVLIHCNDQDALGICVGRFIAVQTTNGVSYARRDTVLKVWSI